MTTRPWGGRRCGPERRQTLSNEPYQGDAAPWLGVGFSISLFGKRMICEGRLAIQDVTCYGTISPSWSLQTFRE